MQLALASAISLFLSNCITWTIIPHFIQTVFSLRVLLHIHQTIFRKGSVLVSELSWPENFIQ